MINIIVKAILWLVNQVYNILMSPILLLASTLFPDLTSSFTYISNFINSALQYIVVSRDLMLIPINVFTIFLNYLLIKFSLFVAMQSYKFGVRIYKTFKP